MRTLVLSIRRISFVAAFALAMGLSLPQAFAGGEVVMTKAGQEALTPHQALQLLADGNERFIAGKSTHYDYMQQVAATAGGQYPYAVILSCIDSRTSSEIIFDQRIGDVFNARIAGNFVNTDILGSMEFACKVAGSKVVLVLGHSHCGAVKGACAGVEMGNLTAMLGEITPAVDAVHARQPHAGKTDDAFVAEVARENVLLAMAGIRERSEILRDMEAAGQIAIVGGMYDLETGKVEFYTE